MGCSSDRDSRCEEEIKLQKWESELRFQDFSVLQGHYALTRFSAGSVLNDFGFHQVADILGFRVANTHKNTAVEGFFQTFRQEGHYNAHDLKVLSVMLSTGIAIEKAPVLFEVFDERFEGSLPRKAIQTMIQEVLYTATTRALEAVPAFDRLTIEPYIQKMKEKETEAEALLLQFACEGEEVVTREQFVSNLTRSEGAKLLSSSGLRKFLTECTSKEAGKT